jgi:hypothetical protein
LRELVRELIHSGSVARLLGPGTQERKNPWSGRLVRYGRAIAAQKPQKDDQAVQLSAAREALREYDPIEDVVYESDVEDAEQLDLDDESTLDRFDKSQRDLVTSVVDYNLGTLSDLVVRKKIDLSPKYQRRFRWDASRQSRLIESFLMNVPIPPIFLSEDQYGTYAVIDGKQRISAIREFLQGRLKLRGLRVFKEINGKTIDGLPARLRDILETRATIRAIIILPQSAPDIKFEVFKRLNTGGVRLNPQEIRNSSYAGPLNDLILKLSVRADFHQLLGIRDKERSALYREMRDAEFILRFLTFRDSWNTFSGSMMRQLDEFMSENQHMKAGALKSAEQDFDSTLEAVAAAFGAHPFQRWVPQKRTWRQQVLASLFDAQMLATRGRDPKQLRANNRAIQKGLKKLFSDAEFRESIDAATNTPALFRRRIEMIAAMLDDSLKE